MKYKRMNRLVIFAGLIALLSLCINQRGLSQEKNNNLYPPENTLIEYHSDWTENHYKERVKEFEKDPLDFGDIVFLGNSITEGGKDWSARFGLSNVRNRGISGDVTDGVLKRLNEIIHYKPRAVFILIGINDLFNMYYEKEIPSPEFVAYNILKIAEVLSENTPDAKIYIQTVLPTSEDYMKENINTVNSIIQLNEKDMAYEVIDLHAVFLDEQGFLRKDLTYDGTHLNEKGYGVWVDEVKRFVNSH